MSVYSPAWLVCLDGLQGGAEEEEEEDVHHNGSMFLSRAADCRLCAGISAMVFFLSEVVCCVGCEQYLSGSVVLLPMRALRQYGGSNELSPFSSPAHAALPTRSVDW
jgi:hypothetical protein